MWQNYLRIETHTKEMCELYTATKSNMSAVTYIQGTYCYVLLPVAYCRDVQET